MKTKCYLTFSLIITLVFLSCGSSKTRTNINYSIKNDTLFISRNDYKIPWPKKMYIYRSGNDVTSFPLASSKWNSDYNDILGSGSYYGNKQFTINQDFYLNPKVYFFTDNWKSKYSYDDLNCLKEWFPNFDFRVKKINDILTVHKKNFNLYKLEPIPGKIKEYITKIELNFIDEQSEIPILSKIYVDINIAKESTFDYLNLKQYGINCSEIYKNHKEDFSLKIENFIKDVEPLNEAKELESLNSKILIKEHVLDDFTLIVNAKTTNRQPVTFEIKGNLSDLEQEYLIKWPSLPININISDGEILEPEVVKVNQ